MSRTVLLLSIVFFVTPGVFGQSENFGQNAEDDDCLVYEEEVHFLDSLQRNADSGVEKLGSLTEDPPLRFEYTTRPPTPGKYDKFELLDQLYGPTEPVVLLDTLRPIEEDPEIEFFGSISTTARTNDKVQQKVVDKYDKFDKFDKFELFGQLYGPTEPGVLLDTLRPIEADGLYDVTPPTTTHRTKPDKMRPSVSVELVRDHLEVPNRSTYVLPWTVAPNAQDQILDQFDNSEAFRGLYDVAPALVASTQQPTAYKLPQSTTFSPRTPKTSYAAEPVRDYLEVPNRSTYVLPWTVAPNAEDRILDQFEDSKAFRGLYDVAPLKATHPTKSNKMRPFVPVIDEFVTDDVTYSYLSQTPGPQPLAPVLDQFATNDVIYPRLKRATGSSDQQKPKRKCLKRRPKVANPAKADVTPLLDSTSHSIQGSREVSVRCSGHRLSDLISIGHCKKFYIRCDQEPKLMMCTRRGQVFSQTLYGCVLKSEAPECPSFVVARPISATVPLVQNGTIENFCQLRADGFYRHFQDCTRVIQCFDGDAFEYPPCPKKLVFDEKRGQCEYKRNVPGC